MNEPIYFSDIEYAAGQGGLIALGILQGSGVDAVLEINPDKNAVRTFTPGDKVVVLATYEK